MAIEAGTAMAALRGLIDLQSRALDEDLPGALQGVVDRLAEVLDCRGVAINLHRPAWDDFEIVAIHAPPAIVSELRGGKVPRRTVEMLLDPQFDVGGAFFIPAGAIDEGDLGGVSAIIPRDDRPDHPDRWQEDDELLIPIRSSEGQLMGFLAIDEPASGLRPGPDDIALAIAVAGAVAAAVRGAQRALDARRSRQALEVLFEISARLGNTDDVDQLLVDCCDGISRALGFERVVIEVAEPGTNLLRQRASVGWNGAPPDGMTGLEEVARLSVPEFEIEGCYLLPADRAMALVGAGARRYKSTRNGRGPLAWDHHWLLVPLTNSAGTLVGWVWPDDPADHLLPTREELRILRTFANQALAAVSDAAHVGQLRELARLDDLTGALNRRAFFQRLDQELARTHRSSEMVTLVLFDLDQFKALNDAHGHPAGDAALRGFTRILERNVRSSDAVGRVGGDEFALALVGADDTDTDRILDRIAVTLIDDPPARDILRASYGTARSPIDGVTRDELVAVADERLYEHKRRQQHPRITLVEGT